MEGREGAERKFAAIFFFVLFERGEKIKSSVHTAQRSVAKAKPETAAETQPVDKNGAATHDGRLRRDECCLAL